MAVREILRIDNPLLRQKSKRVPSIDRSVQRLIDDLVETMHEAHGVGLAAPQVGVLLRIVVVEVEEGDVRVVVNPQFVRRVGERVVDEGCLSLPGYFAEMKRHEKVVVKAQDRSGKQVRIRAEGLLAQALEHEIDHLNGVLFTDYLESPDQLRKVERREPAAVAL